MLLMCFSTAPSPTTSAAGSLTMLPALLSLLGTWVDRGRVPFLGRRRAAARAPRLWGSLAGRVVARPLVWGGLDYAVTGLTAANRDFTARLDSRAPVVFAFVLGLAFLLLMITFRSVAIPLMSIGLNLLSVGAAYGLLTLIFQDGHLERLLGFSGYGGIVPWMPLFLFVILFGLSMD